MPRRDEVLCDRPRAPLAEQVGLHLHQGEVLHAVGDNVKEGLDIQRQAAEVRLIVCSRCESSILSVPVEEAQHALTETTRG